MSKDEWTKEIPITISPTGAFRVTNEILKHLIFLKEKTEAQEKEIVELKRKLSNK